MLHFKIEPRKNKGASPEGVQQGWFIWKPAILMKLYRVMHQWRKEEPTCFGCERLAFAFGQLPKMWPRIGAPVGRIHFAGAAYDNMPHGMDAATRTANRVAETIHAA